MSACAQSLELYHAARTRDAALIRYLLGEMGPDVIEEGEQLEGWSPSFDGTAWLTLHAPGTIIGLAKLDVINRATLDLHLNVRPEARRWHRHAACRAVFEWLLSEPEARQYAKLTCTIPVRYRHVIRFAIECGFRREGINRASYYRDEQLEDQLMLGITEREMHEVTRCPV